MSLYRRDTDDTSGRNVPSNAEDCWQQGGQWFVSRKPPASEPTAGTSEVFMYQQHVTASTSGRFISQSQPQQLGAQYPQFVNPNAHYQQLLTPPVATTELQSVPYGGGQVFGPTGQFVNAPAVSNQPEQFGRYADPNPNQLPYSAVPSSQHLYPHAPNQFGCLPPGHGQGQSLVPPQVHQFVRPLQYADPNPNQLPYSAVPSSQHLYPHAPNQFGCLPPGHGQGQSLVPPQVHQFVRPLQYANPNPTQIRLGGQHQQQPAPQQLLAIEANRNPSQSLMGDQLHQQQPAPQQLLAIEWPYASKGERECASSSTASSRPTTRSMAPPKKFQRLQTRTSSSSEESSVQEMLEKEEQKTQVKRKTRANKDCAVLAEMLDDDRAGPSKRRKAQSVSEEEDDPQPPANARKGKKKAAPRTSRKNSKAPVDEPDTDSDEEIPQNKRVNNGSTIQYYQPKDRKAKK